jgi:cell division protein FtsB
MFRNKLVLPGALLLAVFLFGLPPGVLAKDLSTVQTALRIAQDEMKAAEAERDTDAKRVAATEKEMVRLKNQLEAERKKAAQSEKRYIESKKRSDKAQAAMDQAWKR